MFFAPARISERRDTLGGCLLEHVTDGQDRKQLFGMSDINNSDASLAGKVLDLVQ